MSLKHFFFCLSLLFFSTVLFSQEPVFRHFSVKEGLPSRETYFMIQDSKGYIWICTDAGIVRYNASEFKVFDSSVGLPDNTIFEVKEDKKGRIWFRSFSGHIGYISNDSVITIGAVPEIIRFQKEGIICSFAFDRQENLFVGRQSSDTLCFLKIRPPYGSKDVTVIRKDSRKVFGISIFFTEENSFVFSDARPSSISNKYSVRVTDGVSGCKKEDLFNATLVSSLSRVFCKGHHLYVTNGKHLVCFDRRNYNMEIRDFDSELIAVHEDENGGLYVGFVNGLSVVKDKGSPMSLDFFRGTVVTGIIRDEGGGLWVASLNDGVFYTTDGGLKRYFFKKEGVSIVGAVKTAPNRIILGFANGELYYLRYKGMGVFDTLLTTQLGAKQQNIFFGTTMVSAQDLLLRNLNGNIFIDPEKIKLKGSTMRFGIFKFMAGYHSGFLYSNYMDLLVLDPSVTHITDTIRFPDRVTGLANGEGDSIWVGGLHGLYLLRGQRQITYADRVLDCRVEDVKYSKGRLVVATKEKGVIIIRKGHQDTLDERSGLLSNISRFLYLDGEDIWVMGNGGISRIREADNRYEVNAFPLGRFEGISSIEHVFVMDSNLFFSSGPDLYSYSLRKKNVAERFYISSVAVNGSSSDPNNFIDLAYDKYSIHISVQALFYSLSEKVQYRYKLHADDPSWNYTFENNINLNSLLQGEYEVIIQARNSDHVWQQALEHVRFRIDSPFWQKWWFILLEVLIAASLITGILTWRNRLLVKKEQEKNRLKARMSDLEIKAIKAQMNPHFIFNALNSVQQFVLAGDSDRAYDSLSKFSKLIRKMLESNMDEYINLEDEIDLLRKYMEVESLRFSNVFQYEITIERDLPLRNLWIPHMMIQPFIENAIWHGLAPKRVDCLLLIKFKREGKRIRCTIYDNGVGRGTYVSPLAQGKKRSLGLEFIRERLALFARSTGTPCGFEITDKKDSAGNSEGTLVEIIIPLIDVDH